MLEEHLNKYIRLVLSSLFFSERKPMTVPEILFGVGKYPDSGSKYENDLKTIEEELFKRGLVHHAEIAETYPRTNGYRYLRISSEGRKLIGTLSPLQSPYGPGQLHAISTNDSDIGLQNSGLKNMGLLGFISTKQVNDSFELFSLKLSNLVNDNFYTADLTVEKIERRRFINDGIIGFVFKKQKRRTLRLYRFFNISTYEHLFITNPNFQALPSDYQNESGENPIFIYNYRAKNSLPLYFYSNSRKSYFTPLVIEKGVEFPNTNEGRISELLKIIEDNKLPKDNFSISSESQNQIQVSINEFYFNITLEADQKDFSVSSIPGGFQKNSLVHDSWKSVIENYTSWLNQIRDKIKVLGQIDSVKKEEPYLIESPSNYKFRNDNVEPSLSVEIQAQVFLKLLNSINPTETGSLLGIFGKWGRGKTFFWRELVTQIISRNKNKLEEYKKNKKSYVLLWEKISTKFPILESKLEIFHYDFLEFHAWKFQDTPASWAYLYELFASKYYKRKILIPPKKLWNRVLLNFQRFGSSKLITSGLVIIFWGFWHLVLTYGFKLELFNSLLGSFGLSTILSVIFFYFQSSGLAKDLIKFYFSEVSFKGLLGIQAEIQKELVSLLKIWIPEKKIGYKRLVLFVDDIDRCDEMRIIQIIDSLKIMMDDPEISKRVIVVAAIDEIVLKRAIKQKYFSLIENDLSLSPDDRKETLELLCREYMDKLFINGFKLGDLTTENKLEMFNKFTESYTLYRREATAEELNDQVESESQSKPEEKESVSTNYVLTESESQDEMNINDTFQRNDHFELMDYEHDSLKQAILKYESLTPRSFRIFYYRYLLAKDFKDLFIPKNSSLYIEWHRNQKQKDILPYLLVLYSTEKRHKDLLDEIKSIMATKDKHLTKIVFDNTFTFSKDLYLSILRIIEIVVPY